MASVRPRSGNRRAAGSQGQVVLSLLFGLLRSSFLGRSLDALLVITKLTRRFFGLPRPKAQPSLHRLAPDLVGAGDP